MSKLPEWRFKVGDLVRHRTHPLSRFVIVRRLMIESFDGTLFVPGYQGRSVNDCGIFNEFELLAVAEDTPVQMVGP